MEPALTRLRLLVPLSVLLGALVVMLLVVLRIAGGSTTRQSGPRTWHATVGVESTDRGIQGMVLLPADLWINVGDTVRWTVQSSSRHTVTFLPPGQSRPSFSPVDLSQVLRQGGTAYDGVSYYNSGLLSAYSHPQLRRTYQLTFENVGTFAYICLVHHHMTARVHVRPAGTPYPHTQAEYDGLVRQQTAAILQDGRGQAQKAAAQSSAHQVTLGVGDDRANVMRFLPRHIVIHVGEAITFTDRDRLGDEPHTVSYHNESAYAGSVPDGERNGDPTRFDGTQPLNSGYLGHSQLFNGTSFTVTFTRSGTFRFYCGVHDYLGMKATIVVRR